MTLLVGVDEAGRGAWAGPVVAAAVAFRGSAPAGLTDSKKLTARQRESLYEVLVAHHVWAVGVASATEVDQVNVLQATFLAMRRAVAALQLPPGEVVVDGNRDPLLGLACPVSMLVKADLLVPEVSAASVIAKVTRDRMMAQLACAHPEYGFDLHAGYGVPRHLRALQSFGPCTEHRHTFAPLRALKAMKPCTGEC